ncbi:MAG: hypothetical protein A3H31_09670 [Gallionellales bacterium RIFCSPLOWO2_02_FULL_57_47]|nr:MAG: hypothetical protein A3H31_09670 [Gallionellales bacterium RIFCSPLOWO2_02_FULL_57_47]OGT15561.1 MAG: hypothetical protein A3J49_09360 [Gallionellales bacterium RIFCSPHIGHO2_02_FULL_57_16]
MRNNGMNRLVSVISQNQGAWEGLVVRIIGDNLAIRNNLGGKCSKRARWFGSLAPPFGVQSTYRK